jgi:2-dehydro-3-deoxyglucarate aldolase
MSESVTPSRFPAQGSIGTLVGTRSAALLEMISALGFDFLFLDLEHGEVQDRDLPVQVMASRVPVLARIADGTETAVKRAADAGVAGIIVPHVRSAAMAEQIVDWAKYPPVGSRSVGLSRNSLLGYNLAEALAQTDLPRVIPQIEDVDGVGNIESICAVPGISSVFVGPFDLSAALGSPGAFEEAAFLSAISNVVTAAHAAGLPAGVFAPSVAAWAGFRERGFDYAVLRSDSLFLADGTTAALAEARAI